ncbi:hypothetical protein NW762_002763 [Fusarium torreyae]|uniref:Uncharacterized protein n=1 Tax=Fusarium torreyae TaxID=1237075 RepID=A0A9W8SCN2_9HYPO|nr:hypothetical protein NW762_002763 [Fusarium torreyae]
MSKTKATAIPRQPEPPTDEETGSYYLGLSGSPRLVARSSIGPWTLLEDEYTVSKTIDPVGNHPIVRLWNDSTGRLRHDILAAVASIEWTIMDILRVGFSRRIHTTDEPVEKPITLLVSVQPDSTPWSLGIEVALRCREILRQYGIRDVEVELMESRLSTSNSTGAKLTSEALTEPVHVRAQLSEFLGTSIASANTPLREGTKELYLRLKGKDKILAVTCRHILFPDDAPNVDQRHNDSAPHLVIQPGEGTLKVAVGWLAASIEMNENMIAHALPGLDTTDEEALIQTSQALQTRFKEAMDYKQRAIGHLLFSPKTEQDPAIIAESLDEEAIPVAKSGPTSGLTFGLANEAKSIIRRPCEEEGAEQFTSEEWCIMGIKRWRIERTEFSDKGDSGSCVWDMHGRAVGMVASGKKARDDGKQDTTYVTPIEWLLKGIRDYGFDVELV